MQSEKVITTAINIVLADALERAVNYRVKAQNKRIYNQAERAVWKALQEDAQRQLNFMLKAFGNLGIQKLKITEKSNLSFTPYMLMKSAFVYKVDEETLQQILYSSLEIPTEDREEITEEFNHSYVSNLKAIADLHQIEENKSQVTDFTEARERGGQVTKHIIAGKSKLGAQLIADTELKDHIAAKQATTEIKQAGVTGIIAAKTAEEIAEINARYGDMIKNPAVVQALIKAKPDLMNLINPNSKIGELVQNENNSKLSFNPDSNGDFSNFDDPENLEEASEDFK